MDKVKEDMIKTLCECKKHFEDILQEFVGVELKKVPGEFHETAKLLEDINVILEKIKKEDAVIA